MYSSIHSFLKQAEEAVAELPAERKLLLGQMANYILTCSENKEESNLIFICTHNSRRSHLAHILLHSAVLYHDVSIKFGIFSGGTEVTAFNWRAAEALKSFGFNYSKPNGENPKFRVYIDENRSLEVFSKLYDDPVNPASNFAAVMTCSEADEACPMVSGAEKRFALTYEDPKNADNTPQEKDVYAQRCFQIATEMLYLTDNLNSRTRKNYR